MTTPAIDTEALLANAAWVHRLARRLLRDTDAAEDAAQDALAAALAHPEGFGSRERLRRWLAGTLRHLAGHTRRRQREQRAREARAARPEATDGGFAALERVRLRQRLVEAVLALDEPYRQAIVLRFFEELPPRAIARRLNVSSDTVRQRVARGLARLRARLDRETAGGREAWATALLPLARATRQGILGAEATLVGTKTAAAVGVGLALAAGAWWWRERPRDTGTAPLAAERSQGTGATTRAAMREQMSLPAELSARTAAGAEEAESLLVRVVDPHGNPLPDAWLFRLDEQGQAVALPVDAAGTRAREARERPRLSRRTRAGARRRGRGPRAGGPRDHAGPARGGGARGHAARGRRRAARAAGPRGAVERRSARGAAVVAPHARR